MSRQNYRDLTHELLFTEQSLREVVLYQLQPKETAMADLLGLRPGRITVTAQGLAVELVTQPL